MTRPRVVEVNCGGGQERVVVKEGEKGVRWPVGSKTLTTSLKRAAGKADGKLQR